MPDQGCLWVINPYYALSSPDTLPAYAQFSNESLISDSNDGSTQIESLISLEPQETWCYYFENIDLARSQKNWSKAIDLYQNSLANNLKPIEGVELLPVIQSFTAIGEVEKAIELTNKAIAITPASSAVFCGYWQDMAGTNSDINLDQIGSFYNSENCPVELQ